MISLEFTIFYLKLLVNIHGFLSFANYTERLNYGEITQLPLFYNQFSNFGSVNSFPLGTLEYFIFDAVLLIFPSHFVGLYFGTKFFVVLSSIILGFSFYLVTGILGRI